MKLKPLDLEMKIKQGKIEHFLLACVAFFQKGWYTLKDNSVGLLSSLWMRILVVALTCPSGIINLS